MGSRSKTVLEPRDSEELLRGWLLHVHKERDRHEASARFCESRRYLFGGAAVVLSAVSGSTVFATIGDSLDARAVIGVGAISILAAVFAALQTFLDYPGRAARHHVAAVKYKGIIRELEQAFTTPLTVQTDRSAVSPTQPSGPPDQTPRSFLGAESAIVPPEPVSTEDPGGAAEAPPRDAAWITDLRGRLDALEEATPVVDKKVWKDMEDLYDTAYLVAKAIDFRSAQQPTH